MSHAVLGSEQAASEKPVGPELSHRVLSVLTALALLIILPALWTRTTQTTPALGILVSLGYLGAIGLGAAALVVRDTVHLRRVDLTTLVMSIVLELGQIPHLLSSHYRYSEDEGPLTAAAIRVLEHGHSPYGVHWPHQVGPLPTQLLNGRIIDVFPYPPLSAILGAVLGKIHQAWASPAVIDVFAMVVLVILIYRLMPVPLRPLAVLLGFALTFVAPKGWQGTPVVLSLPLILLTLWQWVEVGKTGRLTRADVGRALCLGLASSSQQLVWFIIPFLVVGMYSLHRDRLGRKPVLRMIATYLLVAAAPFVVINLPFAITSFHAWYVDVGSVITEHEIPLGVGIPMLIVNALPGSGNLQIFTAVGALAYLAGLIWFGQQVRRLAPALLVLAMLPFLFTIRSLDTYEAAFAPLAVLAAIGTWPPGLAGEDRPGLVIRRARWRLVPAAVAAVAFIALIVGLALPPPLKMTITTAQVGVKNHLNRLIVIVHNTSSHLLTPYFLTYRAGNDGHFWHRDVGPKSIRPGQTVTYLLRPLKHKYATLADKGPIRLVVVTNQPQTVASVTVHLDPTYMHRKHTHT